MTPIDLLTLRDRLEESGASPDVLRTLAECAEAWEKERGDVLTSLVLSFLELNKIRARDGAPEGVDHEYFDMMVDRIDGLVEGMTGHGAHCHPILYRAAQASEGRETR